MARRHDATPKDPDENEGYQNTIGEIEVSRCNSHVELSNRSRTAAKCRDASENCLESNQSSSLMSLDSEVAHQLWQDKKRRKELKGMFCRELKCTICFHIYVKPVTLVCGHR
jgi:hypothetical protein